MKSIIFFLILGILIVNSNNAVAQSKRNITKAHKSIKKHNNYYKAEKSLDKINEYSDLVNSSNFYSIVYYYNKVLISQWKKDWAKSFLNIEKTIYYYNISDTIVRRKLNKKSFGISKNELMRLFNKIEKNKKTLHSPKYLSSSDSMDLNFLVDREISGKNEFDRNFYYYIKKYYPKISRNNPKIDFEIIDNDVVISFIYSDLNKIGIEYSSLKPGVYFSEFTDISLELFKNCIINFIKTEKKEIGNNFDYDTVKVSITGKADGIPITGNLIYNCNSQNSKYNCSRYNEIFPLNISAVFKSIQLNSIVKLNLATGSLIQNETLAFLRAFHPYSILKTIPEFKNAEFNISTNTFSDTGGAYRSVEIKVYLKNAYKVNLDTLLNMGLPVKVVNVEALKKITDSIDQSKSPKYTNYRHQYAIIIGVADYKNLLPKNTKGLSDLNNTDNSALSFSEYLKSEKSGQWIIDSYINEGATENNIISRIEQVLSQADSDDLVFIFFSGHGMQGEHNNEEIYLLPWDYDVNEKYKQAIIYNDLLNRVIKSPAQHIVLFIDACHSGTFDNKKFFVSYDNLLKADVIVDNLKMTKVIITSSSDNQNSCEGNLKNQLTSFTGSLIKGLEGEAKDNNHDQFLDLFEVFTFVQKETEKNALKDCGIEQTPQISANNANYHFYITPKQNK
jgi:hypothetical protein